MAAPDPSFDAAPAPRLRRYLPAPNTRKYHLLLGAVALFILGPLGGVTAAYMGFSLGFMVGGQVLAGILGSTVTYGYGAEGKHGANYMQTMAASVASMSGMAVLIQAMVWLGVPLPAPWKLVLYFSCIGMFGIGVGMLYTPILVDRLQLEYPSGHAVANILRALTDPRLLRRSIGKLGGGTAAGIGVAGVVSHLPLLESLGVSASTLGAGLIVGSRIAVPALVMGGVGALLVPYLRVIGWLGPHDPFRKIGFLIALAMIMGAAAVDLTLIGIEAVRRLRTTTATPRPTAGSGGLSTGRLAAWVIGWGIALVVVATVLLQQPVGYVLFALALVFLFVFINGIANGISDSNPISSAFVVSVLLMSALGLQSTSVAMIAASILLVSCTVGVDMQQDRSTGWRLGSDRTMQFRYQAVGIAMGGVLCVVFAKVFMSAYPQLRVDTFTHPEARVGIWQSAMTFKFVGAIRNLGSLPAYKLKALEIGLGIGLVTEITRKLLARSGRYKRLLASGSVGFGIGWVMDAILIPSPYASSFGGFVDLSTSVWFAAGGVFTSLLTGKSAARAPEERGDELPADMSTSSLIGGGLIAGESLYTLGAGIVALLSLLG
jgi:uncharacterized oligopeptide transporter (OPT) family protein